MNIERIVEKEIYNEVQDTVLVLCGWIKEKSKGCNSDEIKALPEVIKAMTELYKTTQR
jgi:hypothetical protein